MIDLSLTQSLLVRPEGYQLHYVEQIDSTNSALKRLARSGRAESGYVLIAGQQTGGRGRLGRSFYSPSATGLYFSFLLKSSELTVSLDESPALAAVSAARAIDQVCGCSTSIKWVNDIYLNDKKIVGILCEGIFLPEEKKPAFIVLGIGINVYQPEVGFPEELVGRAGCAWDKEPQPGLKSRLLATFLNTWEDFNRPEARESALRTFREKDYLQGKRVEVTIKGQPHLAYVLGIDNHFRLLVRGDDGQELALNQGEASLHTD